uniref:Uncharacterized protein n=1 Tax=Rhizophora mucronata TaxID=61149 RepID=A0A2P2M8N1_RHIMU
MAVYILCCRHPLFLSFNNNGAKHVATLQHCQ